MKCEFFKSQRRLKRQFDDACSIPDKYKGDAILIVVGSPMRLQ